MIASLADACKYGWEIVVSDLVSVIIPTYNRKEFISEAIESVLAQTYHNFEVLIIDDGSTDGTREHVAKYLNDSRLHYVSQENQGQSVARNVGLSKAKGELICFLDSDNFWYPEKLQIQINEINKNPEYDIIYGDLVIVDEFGNEVTRKNISRHSGNILVNLIKDNFVSINSVMMRRRCYEEMGGFNEADRLAEDYELWLRYSTQFRFLYFPYFFGCYRVMADQISSDKDSRFWANERTLAQFLNEFPHAVNWSGQRKGWSVFHARKARYLGACGRTKSALVEAFRSIVRWPFSSVGWRALFRAIFPGRMRVG